MTAAKLSLYGLSIGWFTVTQLGGFGGGNFFRTFFGPNACTKGTYDILKWFYALYPKIEILGHFEHFWAFLSQNFAFSKNSVNFQTATTGFNLDILTIRFRVHGAQDWGSFMQNVSGGLGHI